MRNSTVRIKPLQCNKLIYILQLTRDHLCLSTIYYCRFFLPPNSSDFFALFCYCQNKFWFSVQFSDFFSFWFISNIQFHINWERINTISNFHCPIILEIINHSFVGWVSWNIWKNLLEENYVRKLRKKIQHENVCVITHLVWKHKNSHSPSVVFCFLL